jgi:hypothetical protein
MVMIDFTEDLLAILEYVARFSHEFERDLELTQTENKVFKEYITSRVKSRSFHT